MYIKRSLQLYLSNFITALGFALLLIFVLPLMQLPLTFISSGSIFLNYDFVKAPSITSLILIAVSLIFLFFYSVLISLIIFAVRNDLSRVKLNYYLKEKIQKFSMKIFYFYIFLGLTSVLLYALLTGIGTPQILIALLLFIITSLLAFVPQSIVIDETGVNYAMANNFEFIQKKPSHLLFVIASGIVLTFMLVLVEFFLDSTLLIGNFLSLLIFMVFVIPFLEVLKSKIYMEKFELVKHIDRFS